MFLSTLARLRPLFLVAVVLSWNALFLAIEAEKTRPIPVAAILILATANLALAVIAGCVKEAGWAHNLAVRPEESLQDARPILWIVTFLSLALAAHGYWIVWEALRS
jgi:hypothetical protein